MIGTPLEEARDPNTPPERLKELAGKNQRLALAVAQNPNTPPAALRRLAEDQSAIVRAGVAQNPNASPDTFALLVHDDDKWVRSEARKTFRRRGPPPEDPSG